MFFVVCAIPAKSNVSRSMWPSRSSDSRSVCTANMVTKLGVGAAGGGADGHGEDGDDEGEVVVEDGLSSLLNHCKTEIAVGPTA